MLRSAGWLGYVMVLTFALVIAAHLFLPPAVGLANNSDFSKVIGRLSLGAPQADEYAFADLTYRTDDRFHYEAPFRSSEELLVVPVVRFHRLITGQGTFDLRWMGVVHGALLLWAVILLQPCLASWSSWPRALLSALIVLVFGDTMYLFYLNSFYMDAGALVFLWLAVVGWLRLYMWRRGVDAVLLVASLALLFTTKAQHAPLAAVAVVWLVWSGISLWPGRGRIIAAVAASVVALAGFAGWNTVPPNYSSYGCYSVIFFQLLPHATDPATTLAALDLDPSDQKWVGTNAYSSGSGMQDPSFVREFEQRVSYPRLAAYFLAHPGDAYVTLTATLSEAGRIRPRMGNFDRAAGLPAGAESNRFTLWSNGKQTLFYQHGAWYFLAILGITAALCAMGWSRRRLDPALTAAVFALAAMTLLSVGIAGLADAVESARHFVLCSALFDLELVSLLAFVYRRRAGWPN